MSPTAEAHAPLAPSDTEPSVVDALVADMVARWRAGERPPAEAFLDQQPGLWDRPEAALELIAEELVLRSEFGEPTTHAELARRFPKWKAQVEVLLDCQYTLGPQLTPPRFPESGRPARRVPPALASWAAGPTPASTWRPRSRSASGPVVLKLGPWAGGEHLSLARLQHTHIVPLYSAHEFPGPRPARPVPAVLRRGHPRRPVPGRRPGPAVRPGAAGRRPRGRAGRPAARPGRRVPRDGRPGRGRLLGRGLPGRRPAVRPRPRAVAPGPEAVQRPDRGRRHADAARLPPGPRPAEGRRPAARPGPAGRPGTWPPSRRRP